MQERELEKRAAGAVRRKRMQDLLTVLLFMLLLPYTCSVVVRAGSGQTVETLAVGAVQDGIWWEVGNQIRRLSEEDFLTGALAACIPAQYREEALKAQAVILRSTAYAERKTEGKGQGSGAGAENVPAGRETAFAGGIRVSAEESGLAWLSEEERKKLWGEAFEELEAKCRRAVKDTEGKYLARDGEAVSPPFFRLSAGSTRDGAEIFGQEQTAWCRSVLCSGDENAEDFLQETALGRGEFSRKLSAEGMSLPQENAKIVLVRDSAGYVLTVSCGDTVMEGERFRRLFGLASSCFFIREESGKIYLQTKGIGHGLGFDQYQADLLAEQGKGWQEILGIFFEGVEIAEG